MGLAQLVDAILREHTHKPLFGDALFIGRQTVPLTRDEALAKLQSYGIRPAINPASIEIDTSTIHHRPGRRQQHQRCFVPAALRPAQYPRARPQLLRESGDH
jgi:hypothetical protein